MIFVFLFLSTILVQAVPQYYATAADEAHYYLVKNLIGSIHTTNFKHVEEIAVFDLGLTSTQKEELNSMQKVAVYDLELVNPDMLRYIITAPNGRMVRGCFSWKPVIFKQALELYPYMLYMDAGTTVLKPLDIIFQQIYTNGYFLLSCTKDSNNNVKNRITQTVIDGVVSSRTGKEQAVALSSETFMIDAGLQGLSRNMLDSYVLPLYAFAQNIDLFKDDHTAPYGFGAARHDQTLCTLLAYWLDLKIYDEGSEQIHVHWNRSEIKNKTCMYRSRADCMFNGGSAQYVRFR